MTRLNKRFIVFRPDFNVLETWFDRLVMHHEVPGIPIPPELIDLTEEIYSTYDLPMPKLILNRSSGRVMSHDSAISSANDSSVYDSSDSLDDLDGGIKFVSSCKRWIIYSIVWEIL